MLDPETVEKGAAALTICNACRYCEEYCPVFPAIERRRDFAASDLMQLANLCHNCGECLYACQYAPPHPFGVDLPRTLAEIRRESYAAVAWPSAAGVLFDRHGVLTSLALWAAFALLMIGLSIGVGDRPLWPTPPGANFYGVVPHGVMVALFGSVSAMVALALAVGGVRFWRTASDTPRLPVDMASVRRGVTDALTLKHLHGSGRDCVDDEEHPSASRRYFHHATSYGFLLCLASTSVAAVYHSVFDWSAPYAWTSVPVILGTTGGLGLLVGPLGLLVLKRRRDPALTDPRQRGLDEAFITLLFATSLTGLVLLGVRETGAMGLALLVHLGAVLALFVAIPYGKSVHGLYRVLALIRDHTEARTEALRPPR